jgi:hypothetical protein
MALFKDPAEVEMVCQQMRLSDYPRSLNRAMINSLANGSPPYTEEDAQKDSIKINVNDLTLTRELHDARTQFASAFTKPGTCFTARTDLGPVHKREAWGAIVTKEINQVMKRSLGFYESFRAKFAQTILHGIGPSIFTDKDRWCPKPLGIEDVMIPSQTLLSDIAENNLPFLALYRSFKAPELMRLTRGAKVDAGWNMKAVNQSIDWLDEQTRIYANNNWPETWAPEKKEERTKSDGDVYASDAAPRINAWDFYFYDERKKHSGWRRRMILDAWTSPSPLASGAKSDPDPGKTWARGQWLYNSDRVVADHLCELVNFQFADLSAVAPFHYHSVRSLGYLLYSVCHLQNRLNCRFNEAVFESLLMYFRVKNADDMQRALKVELSSRGIIEEGIEFVPAAERYQPNAPLITLGMQRMSDLIKRNAQSYTGNTINAPDRREITATQFMGEQQTAVQLVSAGLAQAYQYQMVEYREIFRRFCRKNSRDADVRKFRERVLRRGVPEEYLDADCWEIEAERVMGAGNKTLELAIAEKLLALRPALDPQPQREILRKAILAYTDDPGQALSLVPEQPKISDSVHDAQLATGALMAGFPVAIKSGINHVDYVEALMANIALKIAEIRKRDNMGTLEELQGLDNMMRHMVEHMAILAQDPGAKQIVAEFNQQTHELQNLIKGFVQRLQQAMEAQAQEQGNQPDPEAMAKIQAMMMQSQAKAENTRESHAQRTAQRQIAFEMEQERRAQEFAAEQERENVRTAAEITRESVKEANEPKTTSSSG